MAILKVLFLVILTFASASENKARSTSAIYLMRDEKLGQWCAYRQESAWRKAVSEADVRAVAIVKYLVQRVVEIELTQGDESGDWRLKDHYKLDASGDVTDLQRTVDVLPEDIRRKQYFGFKGGRIISTHTVNVSTTTDQPIAKMEEWVPEFPIIRSFKGFPFGNTLTKLSTGSAQSLASVCEKGMGL